MRPTVRRIWTSVRRAVGVGAVLLVAGCAAVVREAPPAPRPASWLADYSAHEVTITQTDSEPRASSLGGVEVVVSLTYENGSPDTLQWVRIRCRGIDSEGFVLGSGATTVHSDYYGVLEPGFRIRRTVTFGASAEPEHVACKIEEVSLAGQE